MKAFEYVAAISIDRKHGSTALAHMVLEAYRTLAEESNDLSRDINRLAAELENLRPSMPLIKRFSQEVRKRIRRPEREMVLDATRLVEETYGEMIRRLVDFGCRELSRFSSLACLSHSGTVLKILKSLGRLSLVYVLESRPLREGLLTAAELRTKVDVKVVVDAAMGYAVEESEAVLVGADALFPDGSFSGKVGVRPLAHLSKSMGKPFYVACDTWKFSEKFVNEFGPTEDVAENFPTFNPTFEKVDADYVYRYLTEYGVLKPHEIISVAKP